MSTSHAQVVDRKKSAMKERREVAHDHTEYSEQTRPENQEVGLFDLKKGSLFSSIPLCHTSPVCSLASTIEHQQQEHYVTISRLTH